MLFLKQKKKKTLPFPQEDEADDGRSVASAGTAHQVQAPQEMLMGWSTIGKPGFAYSRETVNPPKGTLVHPVTVQFDGINTPSFSFDRKAGTPTPLNFITKTLNDKMANLEVPLELSFISVYILIHRTRRQEKIIIIIIISFPLSLIVVAPRWAV